MVELQAAVSNACAGANDRVECVGIAIVEHIDNDVGRAAGGAAYGTSRGPRLPGFRDARRSHETGGFRTRCAGHIARKTYSRGYDGEYTYEHRSSSCAVMNRNLAATDDASISCSFRRCTSRRLTSIGFGYVA